MVSEVSRPREGAPAAVVVRPLRSLELPSATAAQSASPDRLVVWQPIAAGRNLGWAFVEYGRGAVRELQSRVSLETTAMAAACALATTLLLLALLRPPARAIRTIAEFARGLSQRPGAALGPAATPPGVP